MQKNIRRGDLVQIKSPSEILETLDEYGSVDGLPFMPEMIKYCGQRFVVDARASKVCDTIKRYHSRNMPNSVLLEEQPRCDGSGHDGCQAECRLFWKDSWLCRIDPDTLLTPCTRSDGSSSTDLAELTSRHIKQTKELDGRPVDIYRCQATEICNASKRLSVWDPFPYIREFTSGNIPFGRFLRISARAFIETSLYKFRMINRRIVGGPPYNWVHLPGKGKKPAQDERLGLQPGEWVQVKSKEEIAATLDPDGRDRGLWFDREMFPYFGGTYRVRQRLTRIIDDRSSRMIEFKKHDCITLEDVVCSGNLSLHRYFCPRHCYPYWRESWLRRVVIEAPISDQSNG